MFKSVFSKYVSAFMAIMLLSFIVIVIITSTAIGRFSGEQKKETMMSTAQVAKAYLEAVIDENGQIKEERRDSAQQTLTRMTDENDDITLLFADNGGNILMCVGDGNQLVDTSAGLPPQIGNALAEDGEYTSFGGNAKVIENMKAVYALPLTSLDGESLGSVVVCAESIMLTELWEVIVRMLTGSVLWVLLAALIAVYFISERVIAPLREISTAAKRFASGHFDVRVPVRGSDEVAELALAFNNMAESLDNYDNMRNSFMSNVSHDLRSPMTSISGFIDGILDGVIPPEQHKYYLQIVSEEIKRLSRLVASLLDLSRIQAGERKFTKAEFDICETARQIIISFEQKIDAKRLQVDIDMQEDRMLAYADRDAVYQVLYNLCDNAVKFSCEGGTLRICIKRIRGKKLLCEVYNEGQGIAPEDINYVFERFYKSDKSRGLNKNGAGLGLFISKTIMDAHDEKMWVESEYGKNCCFRFTLASE